MAKKQGEADEVVMRWIQVDDDITAVDTKAEQRREKRGEDGQQEDAAFLQSPAHPLSLCSALLS